MKKRTLSLLLAVCMVLQLCSSMAFATTPERNVTFPISGKCGMSLTWTLDADGTMTISGSGDMFDYSFDEDNEVIPYRETPWLEFVSGIREIVIEEGVTTIGTYAFFDCYAAESIEIPASITEIGDYAFAFCGMEYACYVTFGGGAPAFSENAFGESTLRILCSAAEGGWTELIIEPEDPYEPAAFAGGWVYWMAADQNGILASGSCGADDDDADYDYEDNLTWSLHIDGTLTVLGSGVMTNMPTWQQYRERITKVSLPEGLTVIGTEAFYGCTVLTAVRIPDSVTQIGVNAFCECSSLTDVKMGSAVQSIDEYAFAYTDITEIEIPAGVQTIGSGAFLRCEELNSITFLGDAPAFENEQYEEIFKYVTATAYYPEDNATWTEDVRQNYGGTLTWVSYTSGEDGGTGTPGQPDTTPPTLTVTGPENGSRVWGSTVLEVSAADNDENITITVSGAVDETVLTAEQRGSKYTIYLTGLAAEEDGKTLTITVTAQDSAGNTAAETLSYIIDNVPNAVADLTAEGREDGVYLSWIPSDPEDNVLGYEIHRETDDTSEKLATLSFGMRGYKDTNVRSGETYTYTVSAFGANLSPVSTTVTLTYTKDETSPVITDVWPATADNVTLCHSGTLQVAATDETALDYAEVFDGDVLIGSADFNASGIASIDWNCADHVGEVTLTYKVYDKAGNSAEQTAIVTVRRYEAPKTPENLTVENGFRSGTLKWSYSGDLQTLKQFNIYDGDSDMLVTSVKAYQHTFRDMEEPCTYKVAAVDIYGKQSFSTEAVTVTPILTENVAPKAVMQLNGLTGLTGKAINFSAAGSSDNDAIQSYTWDFGDGATGEGLNAAHTYGSAGTYTVTLTVTDRSGNTDTAQASVTILDTIGPDATHAVLTVTVQDGYTANTPAIPKATVTVYNDSFELAALTDAYGRAELVVPKGSYTMTVVASGFDGKAQQIDVTETGASTVYLAKNGVSVVDGELTVQPMTREEIEAAGIDTNDPANSHVVKQSTTIRFQPMPEVAFDIPIEQIVDALGNLILDKSKGFGWHTFTPDPIPDDPEEDDDDGEGGSVIVGPDPFPTPPKYDVGVFPVGDSAYMVIYGQTHWLKEMFNVELIVYNNSYAQDVEDCVAELNLPEGLSLAAMLEGEQSERVYIGQIDYIGKTDGAGTAIGLPTRQVNWYVRGDKEGDYSLTAAVSGMVGGDPFQTAFTTDESIHVYAGSALKLVVTMPRSAYADQDYVVRFSLNNVSDKPIYNLTFGIDTAQQFVAERMSDGSTGEVEREYSNEDFEGGMTYGLPTLEPGKAFNLILKTTFEYEHQFLEWAVGKVPFGAVEVGYQVADAFVTTLEGSTTEIPVEIVLEDVKKDDLFQWIWDSTIGALKENAKETIIELIDDKVLQGVPLVEKSVKVFEVITNIKDEITEEDAQYIPTVNVTEGVQCVPKNEVDDWLAAFDTYGLRRSALPGIIVWTDAADAVISADGKTITLPSGGRLYTLRLGETAAEDQIEITTYYVDAAGAVQPFTQTLTSDQTYVSGLKNAEHILLEQLTENTFEIPEAEGETLEVSFDGYLISEDGEILLRAANEKWSVTGKSIDGLTVMDGRLVIGSAARAGTYTVQLALDGTDQTFTQTIVLTGSGDDNTGSGDDNTGSGDDNTGTGSGSSSGSGSSGTSKPGTGTGKPGTSNKPSGKDEQDQQKIELPFGDVDADDWFRESVAYVYEKGLMQGTDKDAFSPYDDTSRAMIVTILWRLAGSPVVNYLMPFADVPQELWYSEAVRWAAAEGIVGGYSASEFRPEGKISREQFAAILWRYAKYMGYDVSVGEDTNILSYDDAFDVSEYAIPALQWTCGAGILRGRTESTLNPMDGAIRAEAATILMRFCEGMEK